MERTIFLLVTVIAAAAFVYALSKRLGILRLGVQEDRFDRPGKRFGNFVVNVLGQYKMLSEPYGIIHFFFFWGFLIIVLGEIQFVAEGLFAGAAVPFLGTNPYFYMLKDILLGLVLAGLIIAVVRRWIFRPKRLNRTSEAVIVIVLVFGVVITDLLSGGARLVLEPTKSVYALTPMYSLFAGFWQGFSETSLLSALQVLWWAHMLIVLGFLVYIPNSKHMHLLAAPFNGYFSNLKPLAGQIAPMTEVLADEAVTEYGVGRIEAFTWKQLLDSFACGECGRCMANCPANLSGKTLNPKTLISRTLKEHLLEKGAVMKKFNLASTAEDQADRVEEIARDNPNAGAVLQKSLLGDVVSREDIWACTTCSACQTLCPVMNEHVNKIVDMRRYEVMNEDNYAPELQLAYRNVESKFNPWGVSWSERAGWAKDLNVQQMKGAENPEYLYWVGCAGSFDSRAKSISVAFTKILQAAGVNFAILGREEKCCGDFIRRSGNEYFYGLIVAENIKILNGYDVKKIITTCPHCLNTLKDEYPAFGGNYEVIHHTQFIRQLIREGKLKLDKEATQATRQKVVYHDSCYLGRYQGEYSAPRELFQLIPGVELLEMDRNYNKSFCCGAGGGRMWMEENVGERINNLRVAQALSKEPQAIGANCPYCITMLEDGVKDTLESQQRVPVLDPAELIAKLI